MATDFRNIPSPYYRVATRAIILDGQNRLLVMLNHDNEYELPGGGWEHDEDFETCLRREVREELGVELQSIDSAVLCIYRGRNRHGKMCMRIAVRAALLSHDFKPVDMQSAFWVSQDEFLELDFIPAGEEQLKNYAQQIWSS